MIDDIDNIYQQPTYDELLRVVKYIARYQNYDFKAAREPWAWCHEFATVAADCLRGKQVFAE